MKYVFLILACLICTPAIAQENPKGRVRIDLADPLTGVPERSKIAWKCSQIANAAVYAHARGKLSSVVNEAARAKKLGSSSDPFFNSFVKDYNLDTNDDFLFSSLFFSQLNIAWLEEKGPYKNEFEPIYTAYLAASCARAAKLSSDE